MLEKISDFFHSGIPYISVSIFFVVATCYGIKLIKDIRDELRKR